MSKQNKTQPTKANVNDYLAAIESEQKRNDCIKLCSIMKEVSGAEPVIWGESIVGFGEYHYKYDSGREGDFLLIGFAARKANISIYTAAYDDDFDQKKQELGKVKLGKSCIYIKKLEDVDEQKLRALLKESIALTLEKYPPN